MHRIAFIALAAIGCGSSAPRSVSVTSAVAQVMSNDEFDARLVGLRATLARSGIELDEAPHVDSCTTAHFHDCVHCEVARRDNTTGIDADLIDATAIAFAMYPPKLLAATTVKHVALCLAIHVDDHEVATAGMAFLDQHRILISVGAFDQVAEGFTIGRVVHHELFHVLDHAGDHFDADREWLALNPKGFTYRDPQMRYRDRDMDDARPTGFVRDYATQNEAEDRASTFELMLGRPEELCAITATDSIVAKKVALLEKRVRKVSGKTPLLAACPKQPTPPARTQHPIDLRVRTAR